MGYEVHIHRREHWADDGADISMDEWLAYCRTDETLRAEGTITFAADDGNEVEGPVMAWGQEGTGAAFYHYRGAIATKLLSEEIAAKAAQIAQALSARAQGDDGEFYNPDGSSDTPPPERPPSFLSKLFGR
jgi:hypothetical protein